MKKFYILMFLLSFCLLSVNKVQAGGFTLKSIGQTDTNNQQISHWWYTSLQPTLKGEAPAGSTVTVKIDGTSYATTADSLGNWSYTPSALTEGDHTISLTNNGSTINFTLTLGSNVNYEAVASGSGTTLPAAGVAWPTLILLTLGSGLFAASAKIGNVVKKR